MKQPVKYSVSFLLILLTLFLLQGCVLFEPDPIPYGIWHSDDPDITLYIDPEIDEIDSLYPGTYVIEGQSREVFLALDMSKGNMARIQPITAQTSQAILGGMEYIYFGGSITQKEDTLVFNLKPAWQEETGYKEIVFEKIGDYPLPEDSAAQ